jgi:hypothetical protein
VDIARGEMVEKELDAMIERRSRQKDPQEDSDLWQESAKAYEEKRRQAARLEWHLHHTAQAERLRRTLEALTSHHEEQAAKLTDIEPKGERNGQGEIRQRLQGTGGNAPAYEIPWPHLPGVAEDARSCE